MISKDKTLIIIVILVGIVAFAAIVIIGSLIILLGVKINPETRDVDLMKS